MCLYGIKAMVRGVDPGLGSGFLLLSEGVLHGMLRNGVYCTFFDEIH